MERAGAGTGCRVDRRRSGERAAARELDHHVHGRGVGLHPAVLPTFPAGRRVRQADGGQRLGRRDRAVDDRAARSQARGAGGRARRRGGDVRRSQPVRRVLRAGPDGAGAVPGRGHSEPADAGGDRAGDVDVHDVGLAGHARDPERDPDAVLRDHAVRRAWSRHHRVGHHARVRIVVARPRGACGAARGRRLRRRCCRHRGWRSAISRARDDGERVRPRRRFATATGARSRRARWSRRFR